MQYLKILGAQLKVVLDCDSKNEYMIPNEEFEREIESVKKLIDSKNPDVIILPEMCYREELFSYFKNKSKNKLIIAGSIYHDGINQTAVFSKGESYFVPKCNVSGAEPMARRIHECSSEEFKNYNLKEHTFEIKGKKFVVLNCMEYYKQAYYIARNGKDIFGLICICSNSNQKVFLEETRAIHNHNERIYTFLVNCISTYKGEEYANGESYIYGPVQKHEREWLQKEGINMDNHCASILKLSDEPEYFYGEFTDNFSRFGRSDKYMNNPRNLEIGKL